MQAERLLDFMLKANRLKVTPRSGWALRGLTNVESVADHSFGVAFVAMTLAEEIDQPIDLAKLLAMALLHDLAEAIITDIPSPVMRFFPPGAKHQAEIGAMAELFQKLPFGERMQALWLEFENRSSLEGRLVRDADRLELLLQAFVYEHTRGNRQLDEFWSGQHAQDFEFPITQHVFQSLQNKRQTAKRPNGY